MSLLDELKKQAQAKQSRDQHDMLRQAELEERSRTEVLPKLVQIYSYLKELLQQIEILETDVRADYNLKGAGNLIGLRQEGYELRADSRDNMSNLTLGYYCVGEGVVKFELQTQQQVEQQKDYFNQHDLSFTSRDYRDERHSITHALFSFEPRILVTLDFQLASDLTTILFTVRNHDGLGIHRYQLEPSRIDEKFLDELAKYILRWDNSFLKLDISDVTRENLRQRLAAESGQAFKPRPVAVENNVTYLDVKRRERQGKQETAPVELDQKIFLEETVELPVPAAIQQEKTETVRRDVDETYTQFANLPTPIKEPKRSELDKTPYVERLEQLRNFPDRLFQTAAQILSSFNRSVIKQNKRLELASAVIGQVYPVLANTIDKYRQQKHSLPENHVRREVLLAATTMVEQFTIAYKHVLKADILEDSGKNFERLNMCAFRILELIRIEQRLRALRYQKLPSNTWLDCNKVFFYILGRGDIDKEFKLLGSASRWLKVKQHNNYTLPSCTFKRLYFSIQLFGVLDLTTWPVWLFQVSDQYLEFVEDGLRLIPDNGQEIVPGWMVTALDQNGPARFKRVGAAKTPSAIIDYSNLYNYLVTEHESLTKKTHI